MAEQFDLRLVFLDVALFEDGAAIRGGVLVTDIETKPYEFRCTSVTFAQSDGKSFIQIQYCAVG